MKVWIYVLAASNHPDKIKCHVPWRVDEELIFFGPCKKRLRECLREKYLTPEITHAVAEEDLFIVGVNGGNTKRIRKVVWSGKLVKIMTFADAHEHLRGERFQELRRHRSSPLHVQPIMNGGKHIGYEHISEEHMKNDVWVSDLVSKSSMIHVKHYERKLIKLHESGGEVFDRDCCLLLENRFFASGRGIDLDDNVVEILRQAQPGRTGIGMYAIFGLTAGLMPTPNGLRGTFLQMSGDLAVRFVAWLEDKSKAILHRSRELEDALT